jgi:hypothetical protein
VVLRHKSLFVFRAQRVVVAGDGRVAATAGGCPPSEFRLSVELGIACSIRTWCRVWPPLELVLGDRKRNVAGSGVRDGSDVKVLNYLARRKSCAKAVAFSRCSSARTETRLLYNSLDCVARLPSKSRGSAAKASTLHYRHFPELAPNSSVFHRGATDHSTYSVRAVPSHHLAHTITSSRNVEHTTKL